MSFSRKTVHAFDFFALRILSSFSLCYNRTKRLSPICFIFHGSAIWRTKLAIVKLKSERCTAAIIITYDWMMHIIDFSFILVHKCLAAHLAFNAQCICYPIAHNTSTRNEHTNTFFNNIYTDIIIGKIPNLTVWTYVFVFDSRQTSQALPLRTLWESTHCEMANWIQLSLKGNAMLLPNFCMCASFIRVLFNSKWKRIILKSESTALPGTRTHRTVDRCVCACMWRHSVHMCCNDSESRQQNN